MQEHKRFDVFIILVIVCVVLAGGVLSLVLANVHRSVRGYSGVAQKAHPCPGDDVAALMAYMESDTHTLQERNHAVWTLGHLGEARALPTLERAYTGGRCDHAAHLCQYELAKAIKRCGGTPNPPIAERH